MRGAKGAGYDRCKGCKYKEVYKTRDANKEVYKTRDARNVRGARGVRVVGGA